MCSAGTRLYVQQDHFDEVVEGVTSAAKAVKVGPGMNPDTEMGPLVSCEQFERVTGYLAKGEQATARWPAAMRSTARATSWNPPCWWTPSPTMSSSARRSLDP